MLHDSATYSASNPLPYSFSANLTAFAIIEYELFNLFSTTDFSYFPINAGIVKAATTPIIPNVINTSARVKAYVFL